MIQKILKIKNVGLFRDGVPAKQHVDFARVTVIYGENGRGKSTIASALRACSLGDPGRIMARRTVDTTEEPEIEFTVQQPSSKTARIQFGANGWNIPVPEIIVFDSEFVDQNVYSGFEVRPDQREALLEFALGEEAVLMKESFESLSRESEATKRERGDAERSLIGFRGPYSLKDYLALQPDSEIAKRIEEITGQLSIANRSENIAKRRDLLAVELPNLAIDEIISLLGYQLSNVAANAEATVRSHLELHSAKEFENWISLGQSYLTSPVCPFCGQELAGLDLIRAYQTYFSEQYSALKSQVSGLVETVDVALGDAWIQAVQGRIESNATLLTMWQDDMRGMNGVALDIEALRQEVHALRARIVSLLLQKESQPLEAVGTMEEYSWLQTAIGAVNRRLLTYNEQVSASNLEIAEFKSRLATTDSAQLKAELVRLEAVDKRFQARVVQLVSDYCSADEKLDRLENERKAVRVALDELMNSTLAQYQERVNQLIDLFNAKFRIDEFKPTHKGRGNPRSEYVITVRGKPVRLGTREDMANSPSFGSALSEADKRTLAFAFFIARLERESDLANKIVVFDDPVSSLDLNRRKASIRLISGFGSKCRQMIVLSHDAFFIRDLQDKLADAIRYKKLDSYAMYGIGYVGDGYSAITECDIEQICVSKYLRNYELVYRFVNGSAKVDPRDVALAIRPLLEGYLHKRFPVQIPRGQMFGVIIEDIKRAERADPLVHLHPIVDDLVSINDYVKDFHHDTTPEAYGTTLNETELRGFAGIALDIIHKGTR